MRIIVATVASLLIAGVVPASAQSFIPARGEGAITLLAQGAIVKQHLLLNGPSDIGTIYTQGLLMDLSLGLGRGFAIDVAVPYIGSKYDGTKPHLLRPAEVPLHPTFQALDNGQYHSTLQDFRAELRYGGWRLGGFAVTPFVALIVPSHSYEYLSHSAVGRGILELQAGVFTARLLDPWLPRMFVQAGYTHGFEQQVAGISRQRSLIPFEAGYFATSSFRLRVFATGSLQLTHGGIDIYTGARSDYEGPLYINHDRITREDMLNLGGGAAFALSDRVDLIASLTKTVWGINGHSQWGALNVGMTYGFGGRRTSAGSQADDDSLPCHDVRMTRLGKCVCLRK